MRLIMGLGNPGEKYKNNRHNIGYRVADDLKENFKLKDTIVKKTNVYMNESGKAVKKFTSAYHLVPSALYVIHDDLDIPLGSYKVQLGKGPKDHKGLNSIYNELGTGNFWHVRIGVDNRDPNDRIEGEEYVLQDFNSEEKKILDKVILQICKKLATS